MDIVKIRVIANDHDTMRGTVDLLAHSPRITVAGPGNDVDVLLVVADDVSVFTLQALGVSTTVAHPPAGRPAVVLVCNRIRRREMLYAAHLGVTAVLGRDALDFDRLIEAVMDAARRSAAVLAPTHSGAVREFALDAGNTDAPLSDREIQVLQLLAEGFDTMAIATEVNYSERTVKHIIHGVVTRNNLRNRAHAVAYALRTGAL
jgi:DNA-binding NarL/FixJ family response regulator